MSQYIASLSYGKDSIAMLHVITDILHWPLDRIITADVWATDTIPADLPPVVEFKKKADKIIKERWGIEAEHFCAMKDGEPNNYDRQFYVKVSDERHEKRLHEWNEPNKCHNYEGKTDIFGFPLTKSPWCNGYLKMNALKRAKKSYEAIQYVGIAVDEVERVERHKDKPGMLLPLVEAQWTEQMCRDWCEQNGLLSPTYETSFRDGCWFCHNQPVDQLRLLRKNYPDLWALLLKWDKDSPVTFKGDGHTVHDYDRRFQWEDEGYRPIEKQFRWADIDCPQMNIMQFIEEGGEKEE